MRCNPVGLIVAIILGAAVGSPASAQAQVWWRQFGTAGEINIWDMVDDGQGGIIVAGDTRQSLAGPNAGDRDAWIARYDATGTRLWIRQFGTPQPELGVQLASDGQGGVFASGTTYGSLWGPIAGGSDGWVARYNADGDQLWAAQFGPALWDEGYRSLTPDGAGGFYAVRGAMLWRFDADGVELWSVPLNDPLVVEASRVLQDVDGSILIVGGVNPPGPDPSDIWIARYSQQGTHIWSRQLGTQLWDGAHGLALDGADGFYLAGTTDGSFSSASEGDLWVGRFAQDGAIVWLRQFGPSGFSQLFDVQSDGAGGVLLAGATDGSMAGVVPDWTDAWMARYDRDGQRLWIHQSGRLGHDGATALTPARSGVFHVAGWYSRSGVDQVWLAQYSLPCRPDLTTTAVPGTPGYGVRNGILNNDDFFYYLAQFAAGNLAVADMTTTAVPGSPGYGVPNGILNNDDFFYYLALFAAGCS